MCQELVREFLGEYPNRWFTVREIADGLCVSLNSTSDNCKMLRKRNQVLFRVERRLVGKVYKDVIVYKYRRC
jgi:hypothetical protein